MTIQKLFLASLLFFSQNAFSWGPVGHRSVALIAQAHLSAKAQSAVQKLLGKETMADVANWADSVRADGTYHQTVWYHFEKISDNVAFLDHLKAMPDWQKQKGGMVEAILVAQQNLRDSRGSLDEQRDTLKFLIHFVGDIHQPLHSGRPEDSGGVKIDVTWFGTPMTLHRIWDSGMIHTGHRDLFTQSHSSEEDSRLYAQDLLNRFSHSPVSTSLDLNQWLQESMQVRQKAYDPIFQNDQLKYQKLHLDEVDERIYSAGVRLADLLNSIYAQDPTPPIEINFWKEIETLVGSLSRLISFRP